MAPVSGHKVEYTGGDKGERDRIGAGHPLAVHGDLSVTRGNHGSGSADESMQRLAWRVPGKPGTSGRKGDPVKAPRMTQMKYMRAYHAMELQVTLPKGATRTAEAGQQSEGSEERVRDEESAGRL